MNKETEMEILAELEELGEPEVMHRLEMNSWTHSPYHVSTAKKWIKIKKHEREEEALTLSREAISVSKQANKISKRARIWAAGATLLAAISILVHYLTSST